MEAIKNAFAAKLLAIKAIKLQPQNPFTWASGWKSPIYTDNRKTLAYPDVRRFVKQELCHLINSEFPQADAVAGVATGAIAQGALVAEELGMPFCYVRSKAKVVVVEDLISTGGSSLKAVEALRQAGFEVVGMVASYTYGFPQAEEAFKEANVRLITISDYEHTTAIAAQTGYIQESDLNVLAEWRKSPSTWMK